MEKNTNKYIAASYMLYDVTDGKKELVEQTTEDRPFDFISGMGIALEAFENALIELDKGDKFDFTLTPEQAYGEYNNEHVLDLDKGIFTINGKFDAEHIYKDAIVPLQNQEGNRFNGRVLDITDNKVKMDLNHPLAGKHLHFTGEIKDCHEASAAEVAEYAKILSGEGGCDGCGGGCGEGGCNCGEGECNCGEGKHGEHHHDGHCGGGCHH